MEVGIFNNKFQITKKQEKEYKKLLDFKDFDFKTMWPFSNFGVIPDEEIYVLCSHFLFRYIHDKSKNRTDEDEIHSWAITKEMETYKKIQKGQVPENLDELLLLLGNNSFSIMVRRKIPKIRKSKTVFGNFKELIKLNRILFDKANSIIKQRSFGVQK